MEGKSLILNKIQQQKNLIFFRKTLPLVHFFHILFFIAFLQPERFYTMSTNHIANQNKNLLLLKLWHPVRVLIKASLFRTCVTFGKPSCRRVKDLHRMLLEIAAYPRPAPTPSKPIHATLRDLRPLRVNIVARHDTEFPS